MERHISDRLNETSTPNVTGEVHHEAAARKIHPMAIIVPVVALLVLVVVGGVPRFFQQNALVARTKIESGEAASVSFAVAKPSPPMEDFVLPGATEAIQVAPIYSRVDGYLHKRYVEIGDYVRAGQVLADIDTPELDKQVEASGNSVEQAKANFDSAREALGKAQADARTADANVAKAKSDVAYSAVEYDRYKKLALEGAVSLESRDAHLTDLKGQHSALEAAQSTARSAQAAVRSAEAGVHVAEAAWKASQSDRDRNAATRSFKKVTALFSGVVTKRNVDAGALVSSGSTTNTVPLFEIADTSMLRVFAYVPEQYLASVHHGETANLTFNAYPGKTFTGTIAHVAGGLDQNSKTLQVEIHIPNAAKQLMPGMYAQVHFQVPSDSPLAIVPATCVQTRAEGAFMYTIDGGNRVHMQKIEIGRDLGGRVEVVRGISIGDRVIVSPSDDVQDGIIVNAVPAPEPAKPDSK